MFGWSSRAAVRASRRKRSRPSRDSAALGRQHLDRDLAVERELAGQVDRAHAAAPEQALDPVLESDRRFEGGAQRILDRPGLGGQRRGALRAEARAGLGHGVTRRAAQRP